MRPESFFKPVERFDPERELAALCAAKYEDRVSAMVALAAFSSLKNAAGYRGKYEAMVEGKSIVAC